MVDFSKMSAGPETDALVAVKIMGWKRVLSGMNNKQLVVVPPSGNPHSTAWWWGKSVYRMVPQYSKKIAVAWQIMRHPNACEPKIHRTCDIEERWYCNAGWITRRMPNSSARCNHHGAFAPTAELAICRAFLMAATR